MDVAGWVWAATMLGLSGLLLVDLLIIGRRPHEPSVRECTLWVCFYVALAALFGLGIWATTGPDYAGQFAAGWLTEYSLSVDNLFVFVIIMSRFAVPRAQQQRVLFIGIVLALIMRGAFIAAGAALVREFVWVFYIFGVFLLITAARLIGHGDDDETDFKENVLIRASRKLGLAPLLVVMVAIGTTDLIFALDSIPAIFGLTKEPYLVFAANVFALMGLRQLYFLLGGLLRRLTYLSVGLAIVLGFIGVKLVMEALHLNNVPFINGGRPLEWVPEIPIWLSLTIIIATLAITTVWSLVSSRRQTRRAVAAAVTPEPDVRPPASPLAPR
ncbi:MAG: TerC family protein [Micromonosporaceae bacterium]